MSISPYQLRLLFLITITFSCFTITAQAVQTTVRTLVSGAAFHGANGIRVSDQGLLYVTSAVSSRIDVLEPHSGKRLLSFGHEQGVWGADDLAFGPDGHLYWTAFFTGEVMRMNANGQAELVARVGPGVNAISFSADGRLFVSRVFLADELYEIDPQGFQPPRLVKQGLGGLNAMDFGSDGYLYGPLWFKGQIARIDVDSGGLDVVAQGLHTPAAVKFSPAGVLHALDQHEGTLLTIDLETGDKTIIAHPGAGADNLDFDAKGRVLITNSHEGGVSRALPNGEMRSLTPAGLSMPSGISIDANGELVVAAAESLRNYDAQTGAEREVIHTAIGDLTTAATPITVSRYGDQLVVSSWFSNTVQIWDPVSQSVKASYQDFLVPLNAIAIENDLIVAELAGHQVVRRKPGTQNSDVLMSGIAIPTGLAYANGQLYVADWLSGSIYQLMADDQLLQPPHPVITGLKQPEGMALDDQGRLLVVETGSQRLLRIDPLSLQTEVLASELAIGLQAVPGYPPSWLLSSVVVDACGRLTVTQDVDNSLLRVVPWDVSAGRCGTTKKYQPAITDQ